MVTRSVVSHHPFLIGCPDCAAIQELPARRSGHLLCWRCRCPLERTSGRSTAAAFACAAATLILLFPANFMLLMSVSKAGFSARMHLASGIAEIWRQEWPLVAVVVALEAVVLPFLRFGLLVASLGAIEFGVIEQRASETGRGSAWVGRAFRWAEMLDLWAMPDVFLIGCAIGYSRLAPFANVTVGAGGWCFVAAALLSMLTRAALNRQQVWRSIMTPAPVTTPGRFACDACGLVVAPDQEGEACPRCRQTLRRRRANAMPYAMAFTVAGLLLYPVANLFPLSVLDWIAGRSPHTLFSAVERLIGANLWFLAACIFTTSIAIPFVKLLGILWFYVSVRRRSTRHLVFKTRLYRVIDELGRWSTMDIFTVAVYMPLIQFGPLASVHVGGGLPALLAVVVLTMLASRCFDPRLLWDAAEQAAEGGAA